MFIDECYLVLIKFVGCECIYDRLEDDFGLRVDGMSILAKGKTVHFDDQYLKVELEDGRVILTPISWYPDLQQAKLAEIKNYTFICQNTGVEWPDLDYQLSIEAMLVAQVKENAA